MSVVRSFKFLNVSLTHHVKMTPKQKLDEKNDTGRTLHSSERSDCVLERHRVSVFAARWYMHKRCLCRRAVSVRPSVRLSLRVSVTFVYSVEASKRIIKPFTARRYAERGLCCRKMSVCRSHAGILSKRTYLIKLFTLEKPHHSSFAVPNRMVILRRRLTGASNAWVWKNRDFRPVSRFISEIIQDRAAVTMECK